MDYSVGGFINMPMSFSETSAGAWVVTSKYEIMNKSEYILVDDIGNGKALVRNLHLNTDYCRNTFYDRFITERTHSYTFMLGAICGDVAGSVYEFHNIKYILDKNRLIDHRARFTDDSVMTLAVAIGIKNTLTLLNKNANFTCEDEKVFLDEITKSVILFGRKYPHAGYGGAFRKWLNSNSPKPYGSWGNGSAMRVSYAGWIANSLEDAEFIAEMSAKITHNHPEGIKGAKAIAGSIYILRNCMINNLSISESKNLVYKYISKIYNIEFTLDEIRNNYCFDVPCQGSVPQAIKAFFFVVDFSEVISLAISIGGDSDTIAAIAGSLAEVIYPIPEGVRNRVLKRLDYSFKSELAGVIDFLFDSRK